MPLEVVDFIPEMYLLWKMCGGNDCANVWLHSGQPFWSTKAGPDESLSWVLVKVCNSHGSMNNHLGPNSAVGFGRPLALPKQRCNN